METEIGIVIQKESETVRVGERDAKYGKDHFLNEPHSEPHTIKFTESMLKRLRQFVADEGYTSLGPAIRELITIGLEYYPVKAYLESETRQNRYKDHPIVKRFNL